MSSFVVALVFGIGVSAFAWSKLAQGTGNARPMNTIVGAGAAGLVAFLVLFFTLVWVIHF